MGNAESSPLTYRFILLFIGVTVVITSLIDLFFYPGRNLTVILAVPILISALTCPPSIVVGVAGIAALVDLADIYQAHVPIDVWPFTFVALLIVGGLGILLAWQRRETDRQARQAEMARSHLQRFLAMVSHDLRGPLFAILSNAELLRSASQGWNGEDRRSLDRIDDSAQSVRRLVQDLLDAARIGEGRFDVTPIPLDLVHTVNQVVAQYQATTSRHVITLDAPDSLEGQWDRERIGQLFANLIANAVAYSPEGGPVRVRLRREGSTVVASVTDEGIGIPPDQLDNLFLPFSRLHTQTKGNGLGLYIARGIVESHGGSIRVESPPSAEGAEAPTGGTRFLVQFPLQPPRPLAARATTRRPPRVVSG